MEARIIAFSRNCYVVQTRFTKYSNWITLNKEFPTRIAAKRYVYGRFGISL